MGTFLSVFNDITYPNRQRACTTTTGGFLEMKSNTISKIQDESRDENMKANGLIHVELSVIRLVVNHPKAAPIHLDQNQ